MSEDYEVEIVERGTMSMDLETATALEFLCQVAVMCDKAGVGQGGFLDIDFRDDFNTVRTVRLTQIATELEFHPTVQ